MLTVCMMRVTECNAVICATTVTTHLHGVSEIVLKSPTLCLEIYSLISNMIKFSFMNRGLKQDLYQLHINYTSSKKYDSIEGITRYVGKGSDVGICIANVSHFTKDSSHKQT